MTPIQSHVAGLELELSKVDPWSDRAVWLRDLIDQAKSALAEPYAELVRQCIAEELAEWEGDYKFAATVALNSLSKRIDAALSAGKEGE